MGNGGYRGLKSVRFFVTSRWARGGSLHCAREQQDDTQEQTTDNHVVAPRSELTPDHFVILRLAPFLVDSPPGSFLPVLLAARRMAFSVLWYWLPIRADLRILRVLTFVVSVGSRTLKLEESLAIPSAGLEPLRDFPLPSRNRQIVWRLSVIRPCVHTRAVFDKQLQDSLFSVGGRVVKRHKPFLLASIGVRAVLQQHPDDFDVTPRHGSMSSRDALGVASRQSDVGTAIEQKLYDVAVPEKGREAQRIKAVRRTRIDRSGIAFYESPHASQVPGRAGLEDVEFRSVADEQFGQLGVSVICREENHGRSIGRFEAEQPRLLLQQGIDSGLVAGSDGVQQLLGFILRHGRVLLAWLPCALCARADPRGAQDGNQNAQGKQADQRKPLQS